MRVYFILIQYDKEQRIIKMKFPDFANLELVGEQLAEISQPNLQDGHLKKFVTAIVKQQIDDLQNNGKTVPDPKSFDELSNLKKDEKDLWTPLLIDAEPRQGFLSKWLPRLGAVSAVVSAAAGTVVSTVALKYALRNAENKNLATAYSIFQSIINNLVGLIIYFYAKSGRGMAKIGQKIDDFISNKFSSRIADTEETPLESRNWKTSTAVIMMKTLCGGIVISNVGSNSVAVLEQLNALTKQLIADADQNKLIMPAELLNICIWVLIITSSISGFSFVGTMVAQLANDMESYITSHTSRYNFEEGNHPVEPEAKAEEKQIPQKDDATLKIENSINAAPRP